MDSEEARRFTLNVVAQQTITRAILVQMLRHHPIDLDPVWRMVDDMPAELRGLCTTLLAAVAEEAAMSRHN